MPNPPPISPWGGSIAGAIASTQPNFASALEAPIECEKCMYHSAKRIHLQVKNDELTERVATLEAEVDVLRGQLAAAPADSATADLERRLYDLAKQEAALRGSYADKDNQMQATLGELARAERTIRNLHTRFERLGMTP